MKSTLVTEMQKSRVKGISIVADLAPNKNTRSFDHYIVQDLAECVPPLEKIEVGRPIKDALEKMITKNYSQLPVVQGSTCVGAVTFESIARHLQEKGLRGRLGPSFMDIPVERFVEENTRFVRLHDDILDYVELMARSGFVLVGSHQELESIVTNYDLVLFFKEKAEIFLILREIETSLRYLVSKCLKGRKLQSRLAPFKRGKRSHPCVIDDLTLGQLRKMIRNNWSDFEELLLDNKKVDSQLEKILRIRNQAFHFRGQQLQANLDSIKKLRRQYLNVANAQLKARKHISMPEDMKDVFDQWFDEEKRKSARVCYDKIFHKVSPFARLFEVK